MAITDSNEQQQTTVTMKNKRQQWQWQQNTKPIMTNSNDNNNVKHKKYHGQSTSNSQQHRQHMRAAAVNNFSLLATARKQVTVTSCGPYACTYCLCRRFELLSQLKTASSWSLKNSCARTLQAAMENFQSNICSSIWPMSTIIGVIMHHTYGEFCD